MNIVAAPRYFAPSVALALIALVFWCYLPGIGGGFVFDDLPNIVHNTEVHVRSLAWDEWLAAIFSSPASRLQRPIAMATFALNHYFTALDPAPMKLTNIAIHAMNSVLVFGLVLTLLRIAPEGGWSERRARWCAAFVAAAWAAQPINFMAVLFVVQRMESLCHAFVFAGLWLYLLGRARMMSGRSGGWTLVATGLLGGSALGVLTKESGALLPLYAGCLEACLLRFRADDANDRRLLKWLFVIVLLVPAVAGVVALVPPAFAPHAFSNRDFNAYERLLTELRVLVDYLHWCVLPDLDKLGLYHDDFSPSRGWLSPPTTLWSGLLLLGLAGFAIAVRRVRPLVTLGIAWFFAAQVLTATVIPLELMFEHRNYFASLGILIAVGDLLLTSARQTSSARVRAGVALALLLLYSVQTHLRSSEWDNPVRFVASEVAKHPSSPRATYELARMLVVLSEYRSDSPHLAPAMKAIEDARKAPGASLLPAQAALIVAARTGQPLREEWWADFIDKMRSQPFGPQSAGALAAMVDCANTKLCKFPANRMLEVFDAALSHGDHPEVLNLYGSYAINSLHDTPLALRAWRESVRLKPEEPQYHINLARLLAREGLDDEAAAEVAALRGLGRMGQNEAAARKLEARVKELQRQRRHLLEAKRLAEPAPVQSAEPVH